MKFKDKRSAPRRFTNAQIAGIAVASAVGIGLLGFGATQIINPTSFVRQQFSGTVTDKTGGIKLTDAQVTKLTDQLVGESLEFFSTDVMTDFIEKAVDTTLDEDTIKDAVLDVVETSGLELSDAQKDAIAKQVRQNVEACWLAIQTDSEGFTDGQVAYLTQLISENIANELNDYTLTSDDNYNISSKETVNSVVKEVLERLFPDNPDISKEYGSGGKILTEDDLAEILGSLDSASLEGLKNQLKAGSGSELEKTANEIPGDSVWEKLGSIFQQMNDNNKTVTDAANTVAQEAAARQELATSLKDTLNTNVSNVNAALDRMQSAITSGDSANASSIASAQTQLQSSVDALRLSLSGSMATLSSDTRSSISTMQAKVTALEQTVAGSGNGMATSADLEAAKTQLNAQISQVNTSLSNEISETQALIKSAEADELEQKADTLEGTTILGKIGALFKKVIQLGDTLGGRISDEVADRESATRALQNDINSKVTVVSGSVITLKTAMEAADEDAIAAAKADLGNALDELNAALAGAEGSAGDDVDAKISTIKGTATALKSALDTAGDDVAALETALSDAQSVLGGQISNLNSALDDQIEAEEQARIASDAAIQAQIHSAANSEWEQKADNEVGGFTIFGKIGWLFGKLTTLSDSFSSGLADETRARVASAAAIQADIAAEQSRVNGALSNMQDALEDGDEAAIAAAKGALGEALDSLNNALTGSEGSAGDDVDAKITSVKDSATALKNALDTAGDDVDALETALSGAQATLGSRISDLNGALNDRIAAEQAARVASDAAIQAQIHSPENTTLEQAASEVEGATVYAKIGSLYNKVTAIEDSEEWVQNVTLSANEESGERKFAIQESTDPAHSGWKMWVLDGESLGLTIRAATATTPESEVYITYAQRPVMIMEYDDPVVDDVIHIYTPSVPDGDIIIRTIHVKNMVP